MNGKSINIHRLSNYQIGLLVLAIIFLIVFVVIFFVANNKWQETKGGLGDLISGTIGVGATFFTMLLIIITMEEQRKMNRQVELHHLVENFNHTFDRFLDSIRLYSKVESETNTIVRKHLRELWEETDGIREILGRFATKKINENTQKDIERLKGIWNDEDLIIVAHTMSRLLDLKHDIEKIDTNAAYRVKVDWDSIPDLIKLCSGFYYAWLPEFKSFEIRSKNDELISFFLNRDNGILPTSLPRFSISIKDEAPFSLSEKEFANQLLEIESLSDFPLEISIITVKGEILSVSKIDTLQEIVLEPQKKITISFGELLGSGLQTLFHQLIQTPIAEYPQLFLDQDICINYNGKEWIYQNQIEFYRFEDRTASIIFKKTQNDY